MPGGIAFDDYFRLRCSVRNAPRNDDILWGQRTASCRVQAIVNLSGVLSPRAILSLQYFQSSSSLLYSSNSYKTCVIDKA
jgi:hypothetical protein